MYHDTKAITNDIEMMRFIDFYEHFSDLYMHPAYFVNHLQLIFAPVDNERRYLSTFKLFFYEKQLTDRWTNKFHRNFCTPISTAYVASTDLFIVINHIKKILWKLNSW